MGGLVSMGFSALYPQVVHDLVLVASAGLGVNLLYYRFSVENSGSWGSTTSFLNSYCFQILGEKCCKRFTHTWGGSKHLRNRSSACWSISKNQADVWWTWWHDKINIWRTLRDLDMQHREEVVQNLASNIASRNSLPRPLPTLLIWGDRDQVVPIECGYRLHSLLPSSQLRIIPGGGHEIACTHASTVSSFIQTFLLSHNDGNSSAAVESPPAAPAPPVRSS